MKNNRTNLISLLVSLIFCVPPSLAAPPSTKVRPPSKSDDGGPPRARNTQPSVRPNKYQLSVARRWALACPAVLDTSNGDGHNELCGDERTPEAIQQQRESLDRWWGIKSHADLVGIFDWIEKEGGHRIFFEEIEKVLKMPNSEEELEKLRQKYSGRWSQSEFNDKVTIVRQYAPSLKGKGIFGWDYARYIGLCRWGAEAGYLSEEEAWQRLMPAARKVQKHFGSWNELGRNYIIGRRFWNREIALRDATKFNQILTELTTDVSSPWVTIPWNTDLRPGPNTGGY
jgi:Protein of unknown function (DUF1266).